MFVVASTALAEDWQPPPWRGEWSTTWQYWEFSTNQQGNIKPDGPGLLVDDPVGPPYESPGYLESTEVIWVEPGPSMHWIDDDESGRQGIWPLSGWMDVIVDNHNPIQPVKWVWLQITWRPQDTGEVPILSDLDPGPVAPPELTEEGHVSLPAGWFESTYVWQIEPNPPWETFTIGGTIDVDELVIDTWCIPEPATLVLLGLGGLLLRRRKL